MPKSDHPYFQIVETCLQYHATLVAVSKTRSIDQIQVLYAMGQRVFGENRALELQEKANSMQRDIEWHLIGHLQTNKVRSILPHVKCIQSLDTLHLLDKIQEEAVMIDHQVNCLLQIKIAREETKYGWSFEALEQVLAAGKHLSCPNVKILGVMGMASLTDDLDQVRKEMRQLKSNFDTLKNKYFIADPEFNTISMGMSGDYKIALEEGSTMIRVGSLLFS